MTSSMRLSAEVSRRAGLAAACLARGMLLACLLLIGGALPVLAHSARSGPPPPGIMIPSLSHGQMAVIARYRSDILDLADQLTQTDPTFRRLLNHERIQFAYCLWGTMPGSISDEASPFNECSHAYLAALRSLLDYMRSMPGAGQMADRLFFQINDDMYRDGTAMALCQFSGETFSTGEVIMPRWRDVFFHLPSLLALLFALAILGLIVWWLFHPRLPGHPSAAIS